jgi:hypothetical protein
MLASQSFDSAQLVLSNYSITLTVLETDLLVTVNNAYNNISVLDYVIMRQQQQRQQQQQKEVKKLVLEMAMQLFHQLLGLY